MSVITAAVDSIQAAQVAVTRPASAYHRLGYKADVLTYATEIKPGSGGHIIARHSATGPGVALPVAPRPPMPAAINDITRQRVLDAVAELRDEAPIVQLADDSYAVPPAGHVWINHYVPERRMGTPLLGQSFQADDPRVAKLLDRVHAEQLSRSPYDFHGGDGQRIFQ